MANLFKVTVVFASTELPNITGKVFPEVLDGMTGHAERPEFFRLYDSNHDDGNPIVNVDHVAYVFPEND